MIFYLNLTPSARFKGQVKFDRAFVIAIIMFERLR